MPHTLLTEAVNAHQKSADRILAHQHVDGYWQGELENKVSVDAHDLLARRFLGVLAPEQLQATARWIRSRQRDGGWPTFFGGPADLSSTTMAYVALRLAGDPPTAPHMSAAAAVVRRLGGITGCPASTRLWLALFGWCSWETVKIPPVELLLLPRWAPVSVHRLAAWAQQTVIPSAVIAAYRPRRKPDFELAELHAPHRPKAPEGAASSAPREGLARGSRKSTAPLRRMALARAEKWLVETQEADGCWGGIHSASIYSVLALYLLGLDMESPVMRAAMSGLASFGRVIDDMRRIQFSQSPVWDTALTVLALREAGVPADHAALAKARRWLIDRQGHQCGDRSRPDYRDDPGGWSFQFYGLHYPDVDDTAEVLRVLAGSPTDAAAKRSLESGMGWLARRQCPDGGWGAFDDDHEESGLRERLLSGGRAITDPPTADVTAHALEALVHGGPTYRAAVDRGVHWLLRRQEPEGPWYGRWGCNYIYGTGAVLPALLTAGVRPSSPAIARAVDWLLGCQNPDGGWGEDHRSYRDRQWMGRGTSTASQTAWALRALLAADIDSETVERGVRWLVDSQRPDGSWEEPQFTGTGFPWSSPIRYGQYPQIFPLLALSKFVAMKNAPGRVRVS